MTPRRARLRRLPTFADQAKAFGCVDAILHRLAEGWVHAIQGEPVFRNPADETWYSAAPALEGWIDLWQRLDTHHRLGLDLTPLRHLAKQLAYGSPIHPERVARCAEIVKTCKRAYRKMDVFDVGSIVRTEMIAQQLAQQPTEANP